MKNVLRGFLIIGALSASLLPEPASSSSEKERLKANRNIDAIGHRDLGCSKGMGNWYSAEQEKELGAKLSASLESANPILRDSEIASYLDHLTQAIARNSDATFPITVRVINNPEQFAITLPGGYQYITVGLLLELQNEGELAAALARGIAHTSLCTEARIQTRANLARMLSDPRIFTGDPSSASGTNLSVPLTILKFRRQFESQADYFGIQYLYRSGYDPECFIHFVQRAWPPRAVGTSVAFSSFPTLDQRLSALHKEISEILPNGGGQITNTPEFFHFREHLVIVSRPKPPDPAPPDDKRSD